MLAHKSRYQSAFPYLVSVWLVASGAIAREVHQPHGHVAAVLGTAELLGLPKPLTERLGGAPSRRYCGLVLALIVNR